jgi:hypothetical protein
MHWRRPGLVHQRRLGHLQRDALGRDAVLGEDRLDRRRDLSRPS